MAGLSLFFTYPTLLLIVSPTEGYKLPPPNGGS